jgi:predicted methyltransferase
VLERAQFIERDLKQKNWSADLGKFDAIITLQAVHELRHKRYAAELHRQVRPLLKENGVYLFCDHYYGADANKNNQLYMSLAEQHQSLEDAGFIYSEVLNKGGRALYNAT